MVGTRGGAGAVASKEGIRLVRAVDGADIEEEHGLQWGGVHHNVGECRVRPGVEEEPGAVGDGG